MRGRKANPQGEKTGGPDESVWHGRRTRRSDSGRRTKRGGRLAATMAAVVVCTAAGAWGIDSSTGGGQGLVWQEFKQFFASTPIYEWLQPSAGSGSPDWIQIPAKNGAQGEVIEIPAYSGEAVVKLNHNRPDFDETDLTTEAFEDYSDLDDLGRCGTAYANICRELMPTEKRGSIGMIRPSGWQTARYDDLISTKYLYNRCHLIAYQLTGENANNKNLITGTRSFNVDGMLPYEEMVGDYVRETGNHVLYRVTPVFDGDDLVAKGVQMEAMSVEDKGEDIKFNVFVYNVQDGVKIDYETGDSEADSSVQVTTENSKASQKYHTNQNSSNNSKNNSSNKNTTAAKTNTKTTASQKIRGNSRSKVYHCPGQRDYDRMGTSKYLVTFKSEKEAKAAGYHKAQR